MTTRELLRAAALWIKPGATVVRLPSEDELVACANALIALATRFDEEEARARLNWAAGGVAQRALLARLDAPLIAIQKERP